MLANGRLRSVYIALAYAGAGVAWIVGSDRALDYFLADPRIVADLQTVKGIGFVVISAVFILLLLVVERRRLYLTRRHLAWTVAAAGEVLVKSEKAASSRASELLNPFALAGTPAIAQRTANNPNVNIP